MNDLRINQEPGTFDESGEHLMEDLMNTGKAEPSEVRGAYPGDVEAFDPDKLYRAKQSAGKRRRKRRGWLILVIAALVILLAAGGAFVYKVLHNPASFFGAGAPKLTAAPTAEPVVSTPDPAGAVVSAQAALPEPTVAPTPTPTLDPYHQMLMGGREMTADNIINVLVIGVDYAEERETWSGKHAYHADVMMLLAINFDKNRVDLISLPRDTYAEIPGVKGIYKLNASLDCGGGMNAPGGAGFLKTCEAASGMLGGIPVDYYYAVTMPAVKQLVDVVGGVDYDLELSYTMMGRRYYKGQQHLDGQGVLDYLRVRKNIAESGDVNRVNRQKKMMVALFDRMQQQNLIVKIPEIVGSFSGQLFTNCTAAQTAALASFAYQLDKENIGMYSMSGTMKNIFNWNFCITDQGKRVEIIKTVYGLDVPEKKEYNMTYAQYRWADMRADSFLKKAEGLAAHVRREIANGELVSDNIGGGDIFGGDVFGGDIIIGDGGIIGGDIIGASASGDFTVVNVSSRLRQSYTYEDNDLYNSFLATMERVESTQSKARREAAKYLADEPNDFKSASSSYSSAVNTLASEGAQLADIFGYSVRFSLNYEKDKDFNEITVDFN